MNGTIPTARRFSSCSPIPQSSPARPEARLSVEDAEKQIREKRSKDLLMAYPLIPLSDEDDTLRRFLFIQQFLKESRQFGAQRSLSERKACEMALKNLAS